MPLAKEAKGLEKAEMMPLAKEARHLDKVAMMPLAKEARRLEKVAKIILSNLRQNHLKNHLNRMGLVGSRIFSLKAFSLLILPILNFHTKAKKLSNF